MNPYGAVVAEQRPQTAGSRRGILTLAGLSGLVGAAGGLLWACLLLIQGKQMLRPMIKDYIQKEAPDVARSGLLSPDDLVGTAYQNFFGRAVLWLVIGVVALIAACFVLAARNWARVLLTVFAVIAQGLVMRDVNDLEPTVLMVLDWVVAVGLLVAVVTQWLPPSNAAVRERKAAIRSQRAAVAR